MRPVPTRAFPIGNGFCAGDNFPNGFADERACATDIVRGLTGFRVEIDGMALRGLDADVEHNYYRALSPEFSLVLPEDNIFGAPAGTYIPAAADGIYLMLTPLSPGQHTIYFHADVIAGGQVDATYFISVSRGNPDVIEDLGRQVPRLAPNAPGATISLESRPSGQGYDRQFQFRRPGLKAF